MNMGRERNHRAFMGAQERKFGLFRQPSLFHLSLQLTSYMSISKAMEVNAEKGCMYFNVQHLFNPVFHVSFIFYRNKMLAVSLKSCLVSHNTTYTTMSCNKARELSADVVLVFPHRMRLTVIHGMSDYLH